MRKYIFPAFCIGICYLLSGCGLMETSFKAGFIMALILAAIIGLLIWILRMGGVALEHYFGRDERRH